MRQKLRKIAFIFILMFGFVFSINAQTKIKENANDYKGDVYIIGSSKFDSGIIVNGTMAGRAGLREGYIQYFLYNNAGFSADDLNFYYFSELDSSWYLLPKSSNDEVRALTEEEVKELTENLNIYYVNEEEKMLEMPFEPALKDGYELAFRADNYTRSNEVKYEQGKIIVPATIGSVEVLGKNESNEYILLDVVEQVDTELKINSVVVKTLDELKTAIDDEISTIRLGSDISNISETITIPYEVEFNGAGYKLEFKDVLKSGLVISGNGSVVNDLTIDMNSNEGWQGNYALQVYNAEYVDIYNFKGTKADAAILVNGSVVSLSGNIDVSENEFGGIEVSKGADSNLANSKLEIYGSIEMTDESLSKPIIWLVNGQGEVKSFANSYITNSNIPTALGKDQTFYYSNDLIYRNVNVKTEEELRIAVGLNDVEKITLDNDIELNNQIIVKRELALDLNGKTLSVANTFTNTSLLNVGPNGKLTIEGNGTVNSASQGNDYSMAVWAYNGGEVIINNGTFTNLGGKDMEDNGTTPNNNELIYALNGTIKINGGKFIGNSQNRTHGTRYTLNKNDNDSSDIIVKGGTFVGYNPEASLSENPQANFVAEGYAVSLINGEYVVVAVEEDDVAISEGTAYKTLSEALTGAKAKSTVKVLKDIVLEEGVTVDKELTLDLNKKTVSSSNTLLSTSLLNVGPNGKLTIEGNGTVNSASQGNDYSMAVWAYTGGQVIINSGTFTNLGGKDYENMETLEGKNNNELIYAYNGSIIINGGRFIGNSENRPYGTRYTLNKRDNDGSSIVVYGGTFVGYNPARSLSENPQANFVAEGYKVTENNGEYTVVVIEETDVAISNGTAYTTLNEAVTNANVKSTVRVLKDIALDAEVIVEKELTLDLNGKTLSPSETMTDDELITVTSNGKLTVEGNGTFSAASQNNDYSLAIWANGGELIIKDGTFTNLGGRAFETDGVKPNNNELIYASNGGKVTIYDGRFTGNYTNPTHKGRYTLNKKDNSSSEIMVYGGTYVEFNPARSLSENPQANFVAEGYKVVENTVDGIREYTVVPE